MPPADVVRVSFITLGCPKNEVDSDRMRASVLASAYEVTASLDDADVAVLNTCAFITDAVEEAVDAILELASWKAAAPRRRLIVTGCLPSRYSGALAPELPEVDAFLSVTEESALVETIERLTGSSAAAAPPPLRAEAPPSAYLMISDGCDRRCSYCTIPSIRGPHRSTPLDALLDEAAHLIARGTRELVLVGQDTTAWGTDLDTGERLPDLLRALAHLDGDFRIRLMYVQPDRITDDLIEVMASSARICPYLEMPVQHASHAILRSMGRPGDTETFLTLIERIRARIPDISLRTTVMVGFPGETRADASALLAFLKAVRFDYVGVFTFSAEDGTPAATLEPRIPRRTQLARAQRVRDLADEVAHARIARHIGHCLDVLIEGEEDGWTVGRTCHQAPEIDGVTYFEERIEPGTLVRARITDADGYDLFGEVVA